MNLLSALFAALACGVAAWIVNRATGSRLAAVAAGVFLAVSSVLWSVATIAEVYALHAFLLLFLLASALVLGDATRKPSRMGALAGFTLTLGLGLAHHPTIVLALPAAIWLAIRQDGAKRGFRSPVKALEWVGALGAALGIAALFYLWMMLRAGGDPASNWGDPATLGALWEHATASAYRASDLGMRGLLRAEAWRDLGATAARDLAFVGLPLAALGVALFRPRRLSGGLLLLGAATTLFALRYSVDDPEVFFLPALLALAIAASLGIAWIEGKSRIVATLAAVAVIAASLFAHGGSRNLRGATGALDYARDILDTVPFGATLFVESDDAFPLVYAVQVLGERQDLAIYHRRGLLFRDLARETPDPTANRVAIEQRQIASVLARDPDATFWFLGWPGYEPPPVLRIEPVGLLWRLARADRAEPVAAAPTREGSVRETAERAGGAVPLAFAATYPLARGERALHDGEIERAEKELEEAMRVARGSSAIPAYVGTLWARRGDWPRAIAAFRRALAANPASLKTWDNLARALEFSGDRDGAREARRRLAALVGGE